MSENPPAKSTEDSKTSKQIPAPRKQRRIGPHFATRTYNVLCWSVIAITAGFFVALILIQQFWGAVWVFGALIAENILMTILSDALPDHTDQLDEIKVLLTTQNIPKLGVEMAAVEKLPRGAGRPNMTIKNFGKGDATIFYQDTRFLRAEIPGNAPQGAKLPLTGCLDGEQMALLNTVSTNEHVIVSDQRFEKIPDEIYSQKMLRRVWEREMVLFIYYYVRYRDDAGGEYFTQYFGRLNPLNGAYRICDKYNEQGKGEAKELPA